MPNICGSFGLMNKPFDLCGNKRALALLPAREFGLVKIDSESVPGLVMEDVTFERSETPPQGWSAQAVVLV
jgi:hypothetical protein